tara:strand:+ start:3966 stop:4943 length:978 start_codon:yes stop_codon:yes gene_type:complete
MISTKTIISDLNDIPREWVFEYYLNLTERLSGQSLKIKSIFSGKDKVPSMCIYIDSNDRYKFKDFSSGYGGDGLNLVMHLFNLESRGKASFKIMDDYNEYISNNTYTPLEYKPESKYAVSNYEIRHWSTFDKSYWQIYKLTSNLMEKYNVYPLSFYQMNKEDDGRILDSITIKSNFIYGYFREDGSLYKIYTPKNKDNKFIKVKDYIQGSDQITFESKYLVILSSLKDLMCFKLLEIGNTECIAPDSENSMIPTNFMKTYIDKFSKIIVLFDNDEPGIKSAKKYQKQYGFDYINLKLSKDLSDSIKDTNIETVKEEVFKLLKTKI